MRITTVDMLAQGLLPRHLLAFRQLYPGIAIELNVGNATLSLTRREADIALRVGNQPPEALVGRRVGRLLFAVYGAARINDDTALADQDWIGFNADHAPLMESFAQFLPGVRPVLRVNSVAAAIAATRAGLGLATLPCGIADLDPGLIRIAPLPDSFTLDLWLLTHEDLRRTARIRAAMDFLADALMQDPSLLDDAPGSATKGMRG